MCLQVSLSRTPCDPSNCRREIQMRHYEAYLVQNEATQTILSIAEQTYLEQQKARFKLSENGASELH